MNRSAIEATIDALAVGDVNLALGILQSLLEDGPVELRARCPYCPMAFEWPGLLDAHVLAVHPCHADRPRRTVRSRPGARR